MANGGADTKVFGASSNGKMTCCHCNGKATSLRKGWQLRSGGFAKLCDRCGSAYDEGTFCERFHQDLDGWRDCVSCGKRIHCGCIMSAHMLMTLDYGGMCCVDCGKKNMDQAEVRYLTQTATPDFWHNFSLELDRKSSLRIGKLFGPDNKWTRGYSPLALGAEGKQLDVVTQRSEGASFGLYSSGNFPLASLEELSKAPGDSKSVLVPLFSGTLTVSDAELKTACLVIPTKYAEAFPEVSEQQGVPVAVEDTQGKDWNFQFHFWDNFNGQNNVYTLEGLRDYMVAMQWQHGDIVEFFRKQPEGKMVIATKKASSSAVQPSLEELPQY